MRTGYQPAPEPRFFRGVWNSIVISLLIVGILVGGFHACRWLAGEGQVTTHAEVAK